VSDKQVQIETIKREICISLGLNPDVPPVSVDKKGAASALGVKPATLDHWRSVGRYNLPYTKSAGRLVRYRLDDLAVHIASRTYRHTGEA